MEVPAVFTCPAGSDERQTLGINMVGGFTGNDSGNGGKNWDQPEIQEG
ncbi:MAG: hypothetical protein OEZ59_03095 [Deltaproteobacteria bacterium]|nr:hypothetical protein [Deltaproteobacteria bacterium]